MRDYVKDDVFTDGDYMAYLQSLKIYFYDENGLKNRVELL
jgi:hypothetical protein